MNLQSEYNHAEALKTNYDHKIDDYLKQSSIYNKLPDCQPLSKEWVWWECCNHTMSRF